MGRRTFRRIRVLAVSLTTATATTALVAIAGAAGPAAAATSSTCPGAGALANFQVASNVAASFSNSGSTTTYTFSSLTDEHPAGGVPGLIKYCVYPSPAAPPTSVTVTATGANGSEWISRTGPSSFAFARPRGNPTNIPLDGTQGVAMGTATWSTVPASQTILLHINDPAVCTSLYGSGSSATCFVKPKPGLICDQGDTTVAYNAMPFDVTDCYLASQAFEAQQTNEFGDEVTRALRSGPTLVSLKVMFASYACSVSGHWDTGDCVTTPGTTFDWPITAKIYDPGNLSTPLATVTVTQTIPYRPSADNVNCTGANAGKWFNTAADKCQYSIGTVLTFDFTTTVSLPATVVWTVAFNTSDYGSTPQRPQACNSTPPGCPYDSLNVGVTSFAGAPYAGTDVNADQVFQSTGQPPGPLQAVSGYTGYRPLGEIITK